MRLVSMHMCDAYKQIKTAHAVESRNVLVWDIGFAPLDNNESDAENRYFEKGLKKV
jgi:hypothetical protein